MTNLDISSRYYLKSSCSCYVHARVCVCVCTWVQVGGDRRMDRGDNTPLVPINLPDISSNSYLMECISTCPTGEGFRSFHRHDQYSRTGSVSPNWLHMPLRSYLVWCRGSDLLMDQDLASNCTPNTHQCTHTPSGGGSWEPGLFRQNN